jgi:hypothetical protein
MLTTISFTSAKLQEKGKEKGLLLVTQKDTPKVTHYRPIL